MAQDSYFPEEVFPGMGPHDIGGVDKPEPIDTNDYGMTHWEKHANALRMALTRHRHLGTLDEMRRAAEDMGDRFYQIGYFERQTESLAIVLMEHEWFSQDQLDGRMGKILARFKDTPIVDLPDLPDDHDHAHEHFKEDEKGEGPNHHHVMNLAMQELMQEGGHLKPEEVRYLVEKFDGDFPNRGPKVVVRSWMDPEFKERLLHDARPVVEEMGIDLEFQTRIIALENTPDTHNVVVCTLCSCYPRFLLGQPPTWYKSRSYRSRVVHEPRAVLAEFGTHLSDDVSIKVHDSNADMRYIVLPIRPEGTENWSAEKLESLLTRDMLIGTAVPKVE